MNVYRLIFTTLLTTLLLGCQTAAQKQSNTMMELFQRAEIERTQCEQGRLSKYASGSLEIFKEIFLVGENDPEQLRKLRIKRYLTEDEEKAVLENHAIAIECNGLNIENYGAVHPKYAQVIMGSYRNMDRLLVQLLDKEINIGEYNKALNDNGNDFNRTWQQVSNQINQELVSSHNQQVVSRQAAWQQFSQNMQDYNMQQQRLNAERRQRYMDSISPTTTTCDVYGNRVTCNSRGY